MRFGLSLSVAVLCAGVCVAQSLDLGRGEVPLTVPAGYDEAKPAPLIVLLHGYTSSGRQQNAYMRLSNLADEYGFLFLAPDGTEEASGRKNKFWNATDTCCNFFGSEVDDSAYVRGLIDDVKSKYAVDPNRVYLIGHSNGGFMSYRMAYDHPETIAAIASLAGATFAEGIRPAPAGPVHVLQIHGTEDGTIRYEGGEIQGRSYPSAEDSALQWASFNGCVTEGVVADEKLDLDRRIDGPDTTVTTFSSECDPSGVVELWTIEGGGHIPALTDDFGREVVEWLLAHPKTMEHTGGE